MSIYEIGRSIRQAIATMAERESARNRRNILRAALKLAHTQVTDEDARRRLGEQAQEAPRAARRALEILRHGRDEFDRDRAYRLLEASIANAPVQPIAPSSIELFSREEALGWKPIGQAFSSIKELVPELTALESSVKQEYRDQSDTQSGLADVRHRLVTMVGPAAPGGLDSLVRSQLALTIATQYLAILSGDSRYGDVNTPYFSAPQMLYIRSGAIGAGFSEPQPPM